MLNRTKLEKIPSLEAEAVQLRGNHESVKLLMQDILLL